VFFNLYVSMVAAGEASGTLEGVLERLADFMRASRSCAGKVGAALAYPALMGSCARRVITVMMVSSYRR